MVIARPNIRAPTPSSLPLLWLQLQNLRRQSELRREEVFNNGARVVLAPPLRLEVLILQSIERLEVKARSHAIEAFGSHRSGNRHDDVAIADSTTVWRITISLRVKDCFQASEGDVIRGTGQREAVCDYRVWFSWAGGFGSCGKSARGAEVSRHGGHGPVPNLYGGTVMDEAIAVAGVSLAVARPVRCAVGLVGACYCRCAARPGGSRGREGGEDGGARCLRDGARGFRLGVAVKRGGLWRIVGHDRRRRAGNDGPTVAVAESGVWDFEVELGVQRFGGESGGGSCIYPQRGRGIIGVPRRQTCGAIVNGLCSRQARSEKTKRGESEESMDSCHGDVG